MDPIAAILPESPTFGLRTTLPHEFVFLRRTNRATLGRYLDEPYLARTAWRLARANIWHEASIAAEEFLNRNERVIGISGNHRDPMVLTRTRRFNDARQLRERIR